MALLDKQQNAITKLAEEGARFNARQEQMLEQLRSESKKRDTELAKLMKKEAPKECPAAIEWMADRTKDDLIW